MNLMRGAAVWTAPWHLTGGHTLGQTQLRGRIVLVSFTAPGRKPAREDLEAQTGRSTDRWLPQRNSPRARRERRTNEALPSWWQYAEEEGD